MVPEDDSILIPYESVEILPELFIELGDAWIPLEFDLSEGTEKTEIICKWADEEADSTDRVGLWVGLADDRVPQTITAWSKGYATDLEVNGDASPVIDAEKWQFGPEARLVIQSIKPHKKLVFYVLCKPRLKGSDIRILTIETKEYVSANSDSPHKINVERYGLRKSKLMSQQKTTVKALSTLNAYNHQGLGNVVHPKQILTLRALEHIVKKHVPEQTPFSIAYIGTDTLENLTCIHRWLDSQQRYDQLQHITAYTKDEWDDSIVDLITDLNPSNITQERKVTLVPNNPSQRSEAEHHTIVISTYVCPWIQENERGGFKELIDKLLGPESFLISVDPSVATSSVRSPILGQREYNPQSVYNDDSELDLVLMKSFRSYIAAEGMIYRRRGESGRNE